MNTEAQEYNTDIHIETQYISEQSDPDNERFVFSYTVTIKNNGSVPAKLLRRHWIITDANGNVQEVEGEGVVGEQPHLKPGEGFRYTSGTVLPTPVGSMQGEYKMVTDEGVEFDAAILPFTLSKPNMLH
ncbi:MAG: Co2+/Mg2+ efflux protein ApaG [Gammaproteobacteria bacterium]|nr:Co2+/Mg2+ efflux protein ApaG [Gammaproteobacteria bacterium]